jgi:hypothetical protein
VDKSAERLSTAMSTAMHREVFRTSVMGCSSTLRGLRRGAARRGGRVSGAGWGSKQWQRPQRSERQRAEGLPGAAATHFWPPSAGMSLSNSGSSGAPSVRSRHT